MKKYQADQSVECMNGKKALEDITIIDLTRVICGPMATMILGDFGANVIKIENTTTGDDTRAWAPFIDNSSAFFAYINRNKKGITLNLKAEEGKKIFLEFVKKADVVVENFRPGVMKKLGIDYEECKKVNEKIIFASASGFGSYGPYSYKPGYDPMAQAMGGIQSLTGPIDGVPYKAGAAIADSSTGINLALGIMIALHYRNLTGKGQYFEVSLVDSIISLISTDTFEYLYNGKKTRRVGNKNATLSPYGNYKGSDAEFVMCCGNQKLFEVLCSKAMNQPELIEDERFKDLASRSEHYDELKEIVDAWTQKRTAEENVQLLESLGIPVAPILDIDQIRHSPHMCEAREMFIETQHPTLGKVVMTGSPYKMSETPAYFYHRAPYQGENNEEIFTSMLGMDKNEIQQLKDKGVI